MRAGEELFEIFADPADGSARRRDIASDTKSASVSPDKRNLLYSTENETILRDLSTNQIRFLSFSVPNARNSLRPFLEGSHKTFDLSWSPTGNRFSYTFAACLFVSDLSGVSTLLYEGPSGKYTTPAGHVSLESGEVSCDDNAWISADRILFHRYQGDLPSTATRANQFFANTTTVVTLGEHPVLVDSVGKQGQLIEVCKDGPFVLLRARDGVLRITEGFRDFDSAEESPRLQVMECRFGRGACELYCLARRDSKRDSIVFINPASLQEQKGPILGEAVLGRPIMDQRGEMIAFTERGKSSDSLSLSVIDLRSKQRNTILGELIRGSGGVVTLPMLLAWIEG
ncbi:MAG: hypothetical protein WAU45_17910 [Blastocatellia bacterium]